MNRFKLNHRGVRTGWSRHSFIVFMGFVSIMLMLLMSLHPRLSHAQSQGQNVVEIMDTQSSDAVEKVLLVLGDSLSAAYGIEVEKGWVNLLQQELRTHADYSHVKVVNASISGETTSGGKQRFLKLVEQHQPSWVILELGANDALRGQNLHSTQRNLESIIQTCSAAMPKCDVMLLGIRLPTNYGPAYDKFLQKIYRDLATKYNLIFDPFFLEPVALDSDLMQSDGLHPNALAQPFILQRLFPKVMDLLKQ